MSKLSIGLVTSPSEESDQLIRLLEELRVDITYHISADKIASEHIQAENLNVWLLNVNDEDWHDNIDQLLDESEASIYFNEPGNLAKQSHPEYWCRNLVSRLYELTGIPEDVKSTAVNEPETSQQAPEQTKQQPEENLDDLSFALDELETNSVGIPSDIAADLVSELESISPELESNFDDSFTTDEAFTKSHEKVTDSAPESKKIETADVPLTLDDLDDMTEAEEDDNQPNQLELSTANEADSEIDFNEFESIEIDQNVLQEQLETNHDFDSDELDVIDESIMDTNFPSNESIGSPQVEQILEELVQSTESVEEDVSLDNSKPKLENIIDLSIEANPVLESTREGDKQQFESVFLIESEDDVAGSTTTQDQQEAETFLSEFAELNSDEENSSLRSDASTDVIDSAEQQSFEIPLLTDSEDESFSLSAEAHDNSQDITSADETTDEFELADLDLESMDEAKAKPVSGRAVFLSEDDFDEELPVPELSVENIQPASTFDGGLALESIGDEPVAVSGKAQFFIDDEPIDTAQSIDTNSPQKDNMPLSSDSLSESSEFNLDIEDKDNSDELSLDQPPPELDLPINDAEIEGYGGTTNLSESASKTNSPESFEIPMLDDAATGLEFEEPIAPLVEKQELCSCWVIGASLGGPAAVKRFLQGLAKDINASFIITQHIDENFLPVLADILTTSSSFEVKVANGSNPMLPGKVYLAPLTGKIIFLQDGSMLVDRSQKWSEPYSPCIDDVIESLSAVYKEKSGAIIFSGMGQDGLNGSKKMKALGGQIWAQSVDTCANPSMPDAVISENLTDVVASPEILAEQLSAHLAH